MSQHTSRLHKMTLESLQHLANGKLELQFQDAISEVEEVRKHLDEYQLKGHGAEAKIVIELKVSIRSDELGISACCNFKSPNRRMLSDAARLMNKQGKFEFALLEDLTTQEEAFSGGLRNIKDD